ncbi:MAG: class I SAM-dependent methyltransferase [Candidatus Aminicenantes bacterium]|nr:class I SAM-dependent methyltransferase [Candidatus Aminicenantes bacterium]
MSKNSTVIQDYEKIWKDWILKEDHGAVVNLHEKDRRRFLSILQRLIGRFQPPAFILELGSGTAIDTAILSRRLPAHLFLASDLSRNAMTVARKIGSEVNANIHLFVSDVKQLPLFPESAHLIFSQGLLEHFKNPVSILLNQAETIKPGGFVVVSVPQKFTGYTLYKHRQMKKESWTLGWETEYSYSRLKKMGSRIGLYEFTHFGDEYWKDPREPMFVLRDLGNKIFRIFPSLNKSSFFTLLLNGYNRIWFFLENQWGHLFMKNLVLVFQKKRINRYEQAMKKET